MTIQESNIINNSGQGKTTEVNNIISERFNWGAFLLTWVWGIFNKTYITLILIPVSFLPKMFLFITTFAVTIWFGIKGNTWAWQNKQWKSIEHFHSVQKKWAIAGGIYIGFLLLILLILLVFINNDKLLKELFLYKDFANFGKQVISGEINTIYSLLEENKNKKIKCPLTENEMTYCIAQMINQESKNNTINPTNGIQKIVTSDGTCKKDKSCKIEFIVYDIMAAEGGTAKATAYLYVDEDGYIQIRNKTFANYNFEH